MNIHLITGSSHRLISDEVNKIVNDKEYLRMDLKEVDTSTFFEEVSYGFFQEEVKYLIVRNMPLLGSNKVDEKLETKFFNFFENPPKSIVVILVNETVDMRKKLAKLIKKNYNFIPIEIDYKNIYNHINNYFNKNGFQSDYEINSYLVNLYGLNLDLIFNELDKLFLFYNAPCKVKMSDVLSVICRPLDGNSFHFINALVDKDIDKVYKLLKDLRVYKVEPLQILVLLANSYRNLYLIKYAYDKINIDIDIIKELKMQDWQVQRLYKSSFSYSFFEIKKILKNIAIYDEKIKTGKVDKDVALQLMILDIIS